MKSEQWKEFFPGYNLKLRYAVSNFGRLKSFADNMESGRLLKGKMVNGYKVFRFHVTIGDKKTNKDLYVHRLVAENFLTKEPHHTDVIFLNHNKKVLHVSNLKWVTHKERMEHNSQSPDYKAGRISAREKNIKNDGHKLRESDVILIKRKLQGKRLRVKMLAKLYNVSETTIYRIARNENWGHVKAYPDK